MRVELRVLGAEEWERLLREAEKPFRFSHRFDAGHALASAFPRFRYTPLEVRFSDGSRILLPVVEVRHRAFKLTSWYSLPLDWEGSPIVLEGSFDGEKLESFFRRLGVGASLWLFGGACGGPVDSTTLPRGWRVEERATHVLGLSRDFEELWLRSFSSKNRNSCRKAEREGVRVTSERAESAFEEYYTLYLQASQEWGYRTPPYPRSLFRALSRSAHAKVWLAWAPQEERPVAGAIVLLGSADAFYWSGAMRRSHRGLAPMNAILKAVIRDACERGLRYLDFGASPPEGGIQKFKESFGARPRRVVALHKATPLHRGVVSCLGAARLLARAALGRPGGEP